MMLALAFLVGIVAGLRSMTAPAVVAWSAHWLWLDLRESPLAFMASPIALGVFTLLALGELVVDKLPSTPNRTALAGLVARTVLGGLSGAAIASSGSFHLALGAVLGAAGGLVGAFGGYEARTRLTRVFGRAFVIALVEDALAIGGGLLIVSQA